MGVVKGRKDGSPTEGGLALGEWSSKKRRVEKIPKRNM